MLRVVPPTNQTCLATNQVAGCRLQKVVTERRVFLLLPIQIVYVALLTGPRQTCFAARQV